MPWHINQALFVPPSRSVVSSLSLPLQLHLQRSDDRLKAEGQQERDQRLGQLQKLHEEAARGQRQQVGTGLRQQSRSIVCTLSSCLLGARVQGLS